MNAHTRLLPYPSVRLSRASALVLVIVALAIAALGEALVEGGNQSWLPPLLYLLGIILSLPILSYFPRPASQAFSALPVRRLVLLWSAYTLTAALTAYSLSRVWLEIAGDPSSLDYRGAWLWGACLLLSLGAALIELWPRVPHFHRRHVPRRLAAALLAVFALALVLRLASIGSIPNGIQADEGDRAAVAIHLVRGELHASIFAQGWFYIPILYYWIQALPFTLFGIGVAQGRALEALAGALTTVVVFGIGYRHFNRRVAWMAALTSAALPLNLEEGRLINEGAITGFLWVLSAFCMLEGARTRRLWAWSLAGISGAVSIYFYPSARAWVVVGVLYALFHIVEFRRTWRRVALEMWAFAWGAFVAAGPYILYCLYFPDIFLLRVQQTTAFRPENAQTLPYYTAGMSNLALAVQQVIHTFGALDQFGEHGGGGYFTGAPPLFSGLYAVLTIFGIAWCAARFFDRRLFLLGVNLGVTLLGIALTVDTPDFIRFSAWTPLLTIFAVICLDHMLAVATAALTGYAWAPVRGRVAAWARPLWARLTDGLRVVAVAVFAAQGLFYYFSVFPRTMLSEGANVLGHTVADQRPGTFVITLARQNHMVNAGWVQLLAPYARRGQLKDPGYTLPLAHMRHRALAFVIMPFQADFIPYLKSIYPAGWPEVRYDHTGTPVVTVFHVPDGGAYAPGTAGNVDVRIQTLGSQLPGSPAGASWAWRTAAIASSNVSDDIANVYPYHAAWHARLRAPVSGPYLFSLVLQAPGRLVIDGRTVLSINATQDNQDPTTAGITLSRGLHDLVLSDDVANGNGAVELAWQPPRQPLSIIPPGAFAPPPSPVRLHSNPALPAATFVGLY